jgi:hypothetical protein
VKIKDSEKADKYREIDFMFVDYNGNIDIVEIKRPNANDLLRKAMYRDNYVPARVLSSTVMQVEKYIFYLNKWGKNGEKILTEKYGAYLPSDMEIRIANPKGLLVLGKEREFDEQAKLDFELIKRQYSNIADIITYDDLLRRIERLLFKFNNKSTRPNS